MSMDERAAPDSVMFSVDAEDYTAGSREHLRDLADWLSRYGVSTLTVDVSGASAQEASMTCGDVECEVVSKDGRRDFVETLRSLGSDVENDDLNTREMDVSDLESSLPDDEVDLVVKVGEPRLVDAAIYNTVYSEVRFVDSWTGLDQEGVEELVEDFEATERRYGR